MTNPMIVVNTTQYEALHLGDPESEKKILEWIRPHLKDDTEASLDTLREMGAYAIRHPTGAVSFVHPADFVRDFDEVTDASTLDTTTSLTEEEIEAFTTKLG